MKRIILLLPLLALSMAACTRNQDQARTSGPDVATAQSPAASAPNAGATSNGADTSGTANGNSASTTPDANAAATPTPAPDNSTTNPTR